MQFIPHPGTSSRRNARPSSRISSTTASTPLTLRSLLSRDLAGASSTPRIIEQHLLRKSYCAGSAALSCRRYPGTMPEVSADTRALRAVSHPLRLRIIEELRSSSQPLRPQDLAQALGEPGNVVRYHVSTLRRAGLLVPADAPAGAAAHERWYTTSPQVLEGARSDDSDTPAATAFTDLMRTIHLRHADALRAAEIAELTPTSHADGTVWLLDDDAARLGPRISELAAELRAADARASEHARSTGATVRRYGFLLDFYPDSAHGLPIEAGHENIPRTTTE